MAKPYPDRRRARVSQPDESALLDEALAVLQPRSEKRLSHEDARQALYNLNGAFSLLLEWKRATNAHQAGEVSDG